MELELKECYECYLLFMNSKDNLDNDLILKAKSYIEYVTLNKLN